MNCLHLFQGDKKGAHDVMCGIVLVRFDDQSESYFPSFSDTV